MNGRQRRIYSRRVYTKLGNLNLSGCDRTRLCKAQVHRLQELLSESIGLFVDFNDRCHLFCANQEQVDRLLKVMPTVEDAIEWVTGCYSVILWLNGAIVWDGDNDPDLQVIRNELRLMQPSQPLGQTPAMTASLVSAPTAATNAPTVAELESIVFPRLVDALTPHIDRMVKEQLSAIQSAPTQIEPEPIPVIDTAKLEEMAVTAIEGFFSTGNVEKLIADRVRAAVENSNGNGNNNGTPLQSVDQPRARKPRGTGTTTRAAAKTKGKPGRRRKTAED